jgi:hypothetical protein
MRARGHRATVMIGGERILAEFRCGGSTRPAWAAVRGPEHRWRPTTPRLPSGADGQSARHQTKHRDQKDDRTRETDLRPVDNDGREDKKGAAASRGQSPRQGRVRSARRRRSQTAPAPPRRSRAPPQRRDRLREPPLVSPQGAPIRAGPHRDLAIALVDQALNEPAKLAGVIARQDSHRPPPRIGPPKRGCTRPGFRASHSRAASSHCRWYSSSVPPMTIITGSPSAHRSP